MCGATRESRVERLKNSKSPPHVRSKLNNDTQIYHHIEPYPKPTCCTRRALCEKHEASRIASSPNARVERARDDDDANATGRRNESMGKIFLFNARGEFQIGSSGFDAIRPRVWVGNANANQFISRAHPLAVDKKNGRRVP